MTALHGSTIVRRGAAEFEVTGKSKNKVRNGLEIRCKIPRKNLHLLLLG